MEQLKFFPSQEARLRIELVDDTLGTQEPLATLEAPIDACAGRADSDRKGERSIRRFRRGNGGLLTVRNHKSLRTEV